MWPAFLEHILIKIGPCSNIRVFPSPIDMFDVEDQSQCFIG